MADIKKEATDPKIIESNHPRAARTGIGSQAGGHMALDLDTEPNNTRDSMPLRLTAMKLKR